MKKFNVHFKNINRSILFAVVLIFAQWFQLHAQQKPSTCDNLDFSRGNLTNWNIRQTFYKPNDPDANNCNQNQMVFTTCPGRSGNSCNGCYSGCGNPGTCPGPGNPKGINLPNCCGNPAAPPAKGLCINPPMTACGQWYDNSGANIITAPLVNGRQTIMSTSVPDPYACNNIMTLPSGDPFAARLGNGGIGPWGTGVGWEIDYLSYTFLVNPTNTLLTYKYAVVLQDPLRDPTQPQHTPEIRPRFNVYIRNAAGTLIDPTCGKFEVTYDTTISGFRECPLANIQALGGNPYAPVGTAYRAWTTVSVDLRNYLSQQITIEFNTWDCGWGGHFGYAYVTARCDSFAIMQSGCKPDGSVTLTAPPGFSYSWLPGGETTQSVNVFNASPGDTVRVLLTTANGCTTDIYTVIYPTTTTAVMDVFPKAACITNNNFAFTDSSYSIYSGSGGNVPIVKWDWKFGDGGISTARYPSHSYTAPGTYTVSLRVTNMQGCMDSTTVTVVVLPPPVASFSTQDVCVGNSVSFQDLSTSPAGLINQWSWTFGDGSTAETYSVSTNPSHTYTATGTYTIRLHITTDVGCFDDTARTVKIWPKPRPNFSSNIICVNSPTTFTNLSQPGDPLDPIVTWMWVFGDNSPFTGVQNPQHTYGAAGTYTVKLTATTQRGCVKDTSIAVTVKPLPVADFTFTPICFGMTTSNFTDLSVPAGTITTWSWNFGDPSAPPASNTSALSNPSHTYTAPGSYSVTLKVISNQGCLDSVQKILSILPSPFASFTAQDVCAGNASTFQDLSTTSGGVISQWSWSFGDGTSTTYTTSVNPAHTYTASGIYTVRLKVTSNAGCVDDTILTIRAWPKPKAIFTVDTVCLGDSTKFIDKSLPGDPTDPVRSWIWVFGDGSPLSGKQHPNHMYGMPGTYTVRLIVNTQRGCVDDTTLKVLVNPLPSAQFSANPLCFGSPVNFNDLSAPAGGIASWRWNFGDANATPPNNISSLQNPTHIYNKDTLYNVKLVVITPQGCVDSIIKPIVIPPLPQPDFDANRYEGCVPLDIKFYDLTYSPTDTVVQWQWTFGDGGTSTSKNPDYTYKDTGVFTVSLTITTVNGCKQSFTWFSMIHVYPWPMANFDFTPKTASETTPTITFTNLSKGEKTWLWNLGDENVSIDYNPIHTYQKTGTYTVWLYVKNQWGCTDSIAKIIVITPEWSYYIPNAFSPNGDGKNDSYIGKGYNVKDHQMWIFDRWGNMIYTTGETPTLDEAIPWNGKANDGARMAQEDVYVWVVQFNDIFGVKHKMIGHVTLVR